MSPHKLIDLIPDKARKLRLSFGSFLTLVAIIFTAGAYWTKVAAYDGRLADLEIFKHTSELAITRVEQQVNDIHNWLQPSYERKR